jgi:hypothetical protein
MTSTASENRYEFPAPHPQPLDPTLGRDYGSPERLLKGWTNGDFPPTEPVCRPSARGGYGAIVLKNSLTRPLAAIFEIQMASSAIVYCITRLQHESMFRPFFGSGLFQQYRAGRAVPKASD